MTLDASPTTFSMFGLAAGWLKKWTPEVKLLVMLRDPVQRAYSHWRMGHNFLTASRCYREIDDLGGVRRVPGTRVLDVVDELTFPGAREIVDARGGADGVQRVVGWGKVGGAVNISDATNECLQRHHMKHFLARVWNARQSWGATGRPSRPRATSSACGRRASARTRCSTPARR